MTGAARKHRKLIEMGQPNRIEREVAANSWFTWRIREYLLQRTKGERAKELIEGVGSG